MICKSCSRILVVDKTTTERVLCRCQSAAEISAYQPATRMARGAIIRLLCPRYEEGLLYRTYKQESSDWQGIDACIDLYTEYRGIATNERR